MRRAFKRSPTLLVAESATHGGRHQGRGHVNGQPVAPGRPPTGGQTDGAAGVLRWRLFVSLVHRRQSFSSSLFWPGSKTPGRKL